MNLELLPRWGFPKPDIYENRTAFPAKVFSLFNRSDTFPTIFYFHFTVPFLPVPNPRL